MFYWGVVLMKEKGRKQGWAAGVARRQCGCCNVSVSSVGDLQSQDQLLELLVLGENGLVFVRQPGSFTGCDLSGEGGDLLWKSGRDSEESQLATVLPVGQ